MASTSSTSSSDLGQPREWPESVHDLSLRAAIGVVATGIVLGAVAIVALAWGLPPLPDDASLDAHLGFEEQTFEFVVLDEKVRATAQDAQGMVVAVGDSSGLHGFDPGAFTEAAGIPARNVATFGFADTTSILTLTERTIAHGPPAAIVLWLHPRTLVRPRALHRAAGYMDWLDRRLACGEDDACLLRRLVRLNQRVSGPLRHGLTAYTPTWDETRLGVSGAAELRQVMRDNDGQIPVPAYRGGPEIPPSIHFDAFETLVRLDTTCAEAGVPLFIVLQPYIEGRGVTAEMIGQFAGVLTQAMPNATIVTALPAVLPWNNFEQPGHLAEGAADAASFRIGTFVRAHLAPPPAQ